MKNNKAELDLRTLAKILLGSFDSTGDNKNITEEDIRCKETEILIGKKLV
ncbi:MAG: hypothetical protein ACRC92_27255 [Peptostreptococcaceae bacterium]